MNNEPVAWMDYLEHSDVYDLNVSGRGIPLYTHPAKTLDRELLDKTIIDQQNEIKELRKNLDVALMIVNEPAKTLTHEEIHKAEYEFMYWNRSLKEPLVKLASELYVFEQAVAILRKAQEK